MSSRWLTLSRPPLGVNGALSLNGSYNLESYSHRWGAFAFAFAFAFDTILLEAGLIWQAPQGRPIRSIRSRTSGSPRIRSNTGVTPRKGMLLERVS